jgi:peptidyl-tRNA hydrolase
VPRPGQEHSTAQHCFALFALHNMSSLNNTSFFTNPNVILGLTAALAISITLNIFSHFKLKKSQEKLDKPSVSQDSSEPKQKYENSPPIIDSDRKIDTSISESASSTNSSPSVSGFSTIFPELTKKTKCKMILVVRNDLNMGKGKIAAQCCHAAVGVIQELLERDQDYLVSVWNNNGAMKIAVKINSEEELDQLEIAAIEAGLPNYLVIDAGHTQVNILRHKCRCICINIMHF